MTIRLRFPPPQEYRPRTPVFLILRMVPRRIVRKHNRPGRFLSKEFGFNHEDDNRKEWLAY